MTAISRNCAPVRVLVVDDVALYRKIIREVLSDSPGVEVVGSASNGKLALQRIAELNPDIVTLDIEMPEMDGIEMLEELKRQGSDVGVIILSALTTTGTNTTLKALELGALDFVPKPTRGTPAENFEYVRETLSPKIETLGQTLRFRRIVRGNGNTTTGRSQEKSPEHARPAITTFPNPIGPPRVVAIGISTGGPQALIQVVPKLPKDFPIPVLIVQHMPPTFTKSLAQDLDNRSAVTVHEATDGQGLVAGHVLIAPGGKQMKVIAGASRPQIRITDDPPVKNCRPSVDYLFQSVSETYKSEAIGVIMTGMGDDGADGCRLLKQQGATIFAQDRHSCVVFGMPRKPVEEGVADLVLPLDRIASQLTAAAKKGLVLCK